MVGFGGGFAASFHRAKIAAGIGDLRFHDLRGTAGAKFYIAHAERVIAEILGWQGVNLGKIIRRYVDGAAGAQAIILRAQSTLGIAQKENKAQKFAGGI